MNQAVSLNADLDYALVQLRDQRLVLAASMVDDIMARWGEDKFEVLATASGQALENLLLKQDL